MTSFLISFFACIIKCLMCITDFRLHTIHMYFSLIPSPLSLSLRQPTHEALFVIFLIQHNTSELIFFTEISLQVPLPIFFLFKETENHLVLTFFTPKLLSKEAFTSFTHNLCLQDAICKSNLVVLTDLIWHALVVTRVCVVSCCPLAVTARYYAKEEKDGLRLSSQGRINITSRYEACCYGDGLTVLFTEKRR